MRRDIAEPRAVHDDTFFRFDLHRLFHQLTCLLLDHLLSFARELTKSQQCFADVGVVLRCELRQESVTDAIPREARILVTFVQTK